MLPSGAQGTGANTAAGVRQLAERLQAAAPGLTVLEATGGYERALVTALAAAALLLVVVNPRQARAFARAIGQLAKTDRLDALALAPFGQQVRPTPRPLPDAAAQALDAELATQVEANPAWRAKDNLLPSMPGVGPGLSRTLLGELPE